MRSAVVVGAGIGGLAVAGGLARTGWQVTLLDRAERLRPGRTAVQLWPNGLRALRSLGLGAGLDAISTPVVPGALRRQDGQWIRGIGQGLDGRHAPVVVHPEDLHDAFIAGLGDRIDIRSGITVRTVRPTAQGPVVGDGKSTWEADLVIAADGTDSVVRQRLAPDSSLVSGGCTAWRAVVPWYRAPQLPPGTPPAGEMIGDGHRFAHATIGERGSSRGGIYWVAYAPGAQRPEPPPTQLALLRRWFAHWHPPAVDLLEATEAGDLVQEPVAELNPLPELAFAAGRGGYALVGDAGHTLVDHLGVGGCLALEDAATLQLLLRDAAPGKGIADALRAYSQLRRQRVAAMSRHLQRLGAVSYGRSSRLPLMGRDVSKAFPKALDAAALGASEWFAPTR